MSPRIPMVIEENRARRAHLRHLLAQSDDPKKDISIYINCPGGSVHAGLAIYDTIQFVRPPVTTCRAHLFGFRL